MIVLVGNTRPAEDLLNNIGAELVTGLPINNGFTRGWKMTAKQYLENFRGDNRDNKPAQSFVFEVNGEEYKQVKSKRLNELAEKGE